MVKKRGVRALAAACAVAAILLSGGCALAPGMGRVAAWEGREELPVQFQYLPDESPEGRITPITLGLVRTLAGAAPKDVPPEVRALFGKAERYTIAPGDVIGVIVYDHPELLPNAGAVIAQAADPTGVQVAPGFIVDSNGDIAFPYIGRIRVQGLTEAGASDLLARAISTQIREPQVTVRIQSFRSRRVYIEGEVRTPGSQIVTDVPMTLSEAINRAGGITSNGNLSAVTLIRDDQSIAIDLVRLREAGHEGKDIPLKSGDVVRVAHREDSKVFVMGEVLYPAAQTMRSNGRLSLAEALSEAGSPTVATSNPAQIYVVRAGESGAPAIFHLDAKNPAAIVLASQFRLRPFDVVYVDPVPLVQWNRVVSLILPSSQVVNNASEVYVRHR